MSACVCGACMQCFITHPSPSSLPSLACPPSLPPPHHNVLEWQEVVLPAQGALVAVVGRHWSQEEARGRRQGVGSGEGCCLWLSLCPCVMRSV